MTSPIAGDSAGAGRLIEAREALAEKPGTMATFTCAE